jgi:hypothetical protein
MQIGPFGLSVLVGGNPAREYGHDGRTFIAGAPGREYTIRIVSKAARRVKAVVSVDGLSVIDGKPASVNGSGYILEPWSALDIPGWRLTDEQVARFLFGTPETSYAASQGKAENVGVIGAAFFDEVPRPAPTGDVLSSFDGGILRSKGPGVARGGSGGKVTTTGVGGSLGTGFGVRTDHAITRVEFKARPTPATTIEVRYEDSAILRGLGVDVIDETTAIHTPNAFPAEGYCSPPNGWRGA